MVKDKMKVAISNFGNESIALIQYCVEQNIALDAVLWVDTGWAEESFERRQGSVLGWLKNKEIEAIKLKPASNFSTLVNVKNAFPSAKYQWCTSFLKGLPINEWLDEHDQGECAKVYLPHCLDKSLKFQEVARKSYSESYGGREVRLPLFDCTKEAIQQLVSRAKLPWLTHRSLECEPCIHNCKQDFLRLSECDSERLAQLEQSIDKPMFPAARFGGQWGITAIVQWMKKPENFDKVADHQPFMQGCGNPFGCGM